MANKRICDRCGKTICENTNNPLDNLVNNFIKHLYLKEVTLLSSESEIDLCPECEASLYKWLENKEEKC